MGKRCVIPVIRYPKSEREHRFCMNSTVLKTFGFWAALVASVCGVLLSQHVFMDGSTLAAIIGWIMTIGGAAGAGHQVATAKQLSA